MGAKLLLVDDDEINLATLEAILGSEDYELHYAGTGIDACRLAEQLSPDLILLDVMMPGMSGLDVCRHLRAQPSIKSVPIILLTSLNDHASRLEGLRAGADDLISKPCAFEELRARVATITRLNRFRVIAEQRARFQHLFTIAPAAILMLDVAGSVVTANEKALALFGARQPADLEGCPLQNHCPPESADALRSLVRLACDRDEPAAPAYLRLPVSGAERIFSTQASRLDESDPLLVMLILSDVTAEVRAREEAESMNRRLDALVQARTGQLENANELLMSYAVFISHDLRSPLTAVQSYLSLIETDPSIAVSKDVLAFISGAHSSAQMMGDMIRSLLQLAADEKDRPSAPPEPVDPTPIIERLTWKIAAFRHDSKPRFTLGVLPLVVARPALVERVFYNLLVNAVKYSACRENPEIEIGAHPTPDGTAIYVRDNGVGFDQTDAGRLFREFSRLPGAERSEGLGLGLSLVSRLLRSHHGRIWAEGEHGKGATFFVQFDARAG